MQKQVLLYGLPKGQTERYMEALLHSNLTSEAHIEQIKELAAKNGFHSFRVATWDGSPPNFAKAVK